MSAAAATYVVLAVAVLLFVTNRVPVAVVALGVALALYGTGVLDLGQAFGGFGDPIVVLVASLFVVAEGLDATGITAWLGRRLIDHAGGRASRATLLTMLLAAGLSALITPNGAAAALVPVAVVLCVRLRIPPSRLLMPLAFAAHAGSLLLLTGTPVNVLVADAAETSGAGRIGFASFALVGIPLLVATVAVTLLFGNRLLPRRTPPSMPADLSALSRTLVRDYGLDGSAAAPHTTAPPTTAAAGFPVLFSEDHGAAEVVVPPRSDVLGRRVFPGMTTPEGDVVVLAVHRNGAPVAPSGVELAAGDILLVRGSWAALEDYLATRDVLPVVEPDIIRRQTAPLAGRAWVALGVTAVMVVLLATGVVPPAVGALLGALGMVVGGVLRVEQAYRAVDWTTVVLIGAMIPLSTAMVSTGAADQLAHGLVAAVGGGGPYLLLTGLFLLTAVLGQLISNTATALIVVPIGLAAAAETGVSPLPVLMSVAVAAAAALLTPIATPANMIVYGPAGYRFGDYLRLGLPLLAAYYGVGVFLVPVFWPF